MEWRWRDEEGLEEGGEVIFGLLNININLRNVGSPKYKLKTICRELVN